MSEKLWKVPEDLQKKIDEYFKKPRTEWGITDLAVQLGTSRRTLSNYEEKDDFFHIIKRAKGRIESEYERRGWEKPSSFAIFALKNIGWEDHQNVDHTSGGEKMQIVIQSYGNQNTPQLPAGTPTVSVRSVERPKEIQSNSGTPKSGKNLSGSK